MEKIALPTTADLSGGVQLRYMPITRFMKGIAGVLMALLFQAAGEVRGQAPQGSYEVTFKWNASASTDVTGYRIHYGTASRAYTASVVLGNVTSGTVSGLVEGVTYYFALSAFNAEGLESDLTHEVIFKPGLHTSRIGIDANGEAVMTVRGLIGRQYDIEASEDLNSWALIDTITMPEGGSMKFTDPDAPLYARRFYRSRATP